MFCSGGCKYIRKTPFEGLPLCTSCSANIITYTSTVAHIEDILEGKCKVLFMHALLPLHGWQDAISITALSGSSDLQLAPLQRRAKPLNSAGV